MTRARGLAGFASAISGPVNSTDLNVGVLTATNVSVGGTITYEDVSNVDSVGIITAQAGIRVTGGSVGIGSDIPQNKLDVAGDVKILDNSPRLFFYDANANDASSATGGFEVFDKDGNKNVFVGAFAPNADNLIFGVTGSERARITSDGNLGIGTDSPGRTLHVLDSTSIVARFESTGTSFGGIELKDANTTADFKVQLAAVGNELRIDAGGSERLRIDANGKVGINTDPTQLFEILVSETTGSRIHTNLAGSGNKFVAWTIDGGISTNDSRAELDFNHGGTTYGTLYTGFSTNSGTASNFTLRSLNADTHINITPNSTLRAIFATDGALYVGTSVGDGSGSDAGVVKARGYNTKNGYSAGLGVNVFNIGWSSPNASLYIDTTNIGVFVSSSDYRIKDNVVSITSTCIDRIKQLRPVQYEYTNYGSLFTADGVTREGFIAHEVQEVIPSGAQGVKDDPNEIQSLKVDAILSVTVKALQEAIAKIETLETKVAALEGN